MERQNFYLGIDLGSVSLKFAIMDGEGRIAFERWARVQGEPKKALSRMFSEANDKLPGITLSGICATGSGRELVCGLIGVRGINEISAHAMSAAGLDPSIRTIIEIGGQDSKLIVLNERGAVEDFRMNELCAAGTGAFLDQQAARLGISIDGFARLAIQATDPVPIAARCAVFAKTDMTHHQQEGKSLPDIVAGLNEALARSYMANLVRGRQLPRPIAFQGGVASNLGLRRAFEKILGLSDGELVVLKHHLTMGAIGAAFSAKENPFENARTIDQLVSSMENCRGDEQKNVSGSSLAPEGDLQISHIEARPSLCKFEDRFLGIDIGSVSVKVAVLGPAGVEYQDYCFSEGMPIETLRAIIDNMTRLNERTDFRAVGITGSGRNLIGKLFGADVVINEISAQAKASAVLLPSVDTVIEIGGQDAKFMRIEGGRPVHFSMNRVCAAGTGAFLQEQAKRLGVALENEFSDEALKSDNPANLGSRCTVFMESDLVSHQQKGFAKKDLAAGLAMSVVANYMDKVVCGHPIGQNVLFLGGVAKNAAVVAALGKKLARPISISKFGVVSGAIGAALAAHDAFTSDPSMKSSFGATADISIVKERCEDCENRCMITKVRGEPNKTSGGRCGKWDKASRTKSRTKSSLIEERQRLVCRIPNKKELGLVSPIGIPMAMFAFDKLTLWTAFFEKLGHKVVVSPRTNEKMLVRGYKRMVAETCLPMKAFGAHVSWLDECEDVDAVFVPSLVTCGMDVHKRETLHCPYVMSLVQFARHMTSKPIVNPVISYKWHPDDERRQMIAAAMELGHSKGDARAAFDDAMKEHLAAKASLRAIGDGILEDLKSGKLSRAFVVLGKDYNVCDPMLNCDAVKILESFGEVALTQDMLVDDSGKYSRAFRTMSWTHGKEILAAAEVAGRTPGLYPVMITSFGCGPDSFTINFARDAAANKPFLVLEVDEHSSSVGMETRIEAFLDSLPKPVPSEEYRPAAEYIPRHKIRRVFLPNFSDHGMAFAAAIRVLGFEPVMTELPDDEAHEMGVSHSSTGECHPYTLMLGSYIKAAKSCEDPSDACYFVPDSGLCRVGMFGAGMRRITDQTGLRLPVVGDLSQLVPAAGDRSSSAFIKALVAYWEMMRGMDLLMQKHFETRAYETAAGSADAAHEKALAAVWKHIIGGRHIDGLREAAAIMNGVEVDRSAKKFKIGITGDYYTRICAFANGDIFRDIERMGGVVMLPPTICEFVKYDAYQKPVWSFNHRRAKDLAVSAASRWMIERSERKVMDIFKGSLDYTIPIDYRREVELIKPYMDKKLPSGIAASVGSIMEHLEAGADGILNIITFHCTYGLVLSAVLSSIEKERPDVPKLTLIFEGLKPTHNRTRLEAFMERVRRRHAD